MGSCNLKALLKRRLEDSLDLTEDLCEIYMVENLTNNHEHHGRRYHNGIIPKIGRSDLKTEDGQINERRWSMVWYERVWKKVRKKGGGHDTKLFDNYLAGRHKGTAKQSVKEYPGNYFNAVFKSERQSWEPELVLTFEKVFLPLRKKVFLYRKALEFLERAENADEELRAMVKQVMDTPSKQHDFRSCMIEFIEDSMHRELKDLEELSVLIDGQEDDHD